MLDKKQFIILFFSILIFISPLIVTCIICINNNYKKRKNIKNVIDKYTIKYDRLDNNIEIISN